MNTILMNPWSWWHFGYMASLLKLYKTLQVVFWGKTNFGIGPKHTDSYNKQ